MIAPIKPQPQPEAAQLAGARRTVAALFFRDSPQRTTRGGTVSQKAAWMFVGWAVFVTVAYFLRGAR